MIKSANGMVHIEGTRSLCMAELGTLIAGMMDSGLTEDEILFSCMAGLNHEMVLEHPDTAFEMIRDAVENRK